MKHFAISTVLAGGMFAGLLGMAGAAHADYWENPYTSPGTGSNNVIVPHVDTTVHHSR